MTIDADSRPSSVGSGWFRHARAAFVVVHLVMVALLNLPRVPEGGDPVEVMRVQPAVDAVARWTGVPSSAAREVAGSALDGWRSTWRVVGPVPYAYGRYTGAKQGWPMYSSVSDRTFRLVVERREGEVWHPVFVPHRLEAWPDGLLLHGRVRTTWARYGHGWWPASWPAFVGWLEPMLRADHPDADGFRVAMEAMRIPPPEVLLRTRTLPVTERFWELELVIEEGDP